MRTIELRTPALPCLVPAGVFDGLAWCEEPSLEWRCPGDAVTVNPFDAALPLGFAFVFRAPWDALPAELAWLHTGGSQARALGLTTETALAPYAIDDATDLLWEHRRPAGETFWLAADNLNGLHWALHDWAHFHNHGPFVDRPATEYQCDVSALAWLWINRGALPLAEAQWRAWVADVCAFHRAFCAATPGTVSPSPALLADPDALRALAESL